MPRDAGAQDVQQLLAAPRLGLVITLRLVGLAPWESAQWE